MTSKTPIVDLTLLLKYAKDKFVRSESIYTQVSVKNGGSAPLEIEDLTMLNNPLRFYAMNSSGEKFSGSLLGSLARDGTRIPTPIRKNLTTLKPQEAKVIDVDLVEILGELPEGNYKIRASYQSKGILYSQSNTIEIQILKSAPVYSCTFQDYLRMDSPVRTAWINEEEDGLHLFIMENSLDFPQVLRSNRRIMRLEKLSRVFLSVPESYGQDYEALVWNEGDIVHSVIVFEGQFKKKMEVQLPISGFKLLEPLLTDEEGTLRVVVLSKEGDATIFHLISFPVDGKVETSEICRHKGQIEKCSVAFDADLKIHLAWASKSGDIYYIQKDIEDTLKRKREAELLFSGGTPPMDLQFSLACSDEEGNSLLMLHYLNRESDGKLCSHVMDVETKKLVLESFFPVPPKEELKLLHVALDMDCQPHFLFQGGFGALLFKAFEGAELVRVTEEGEAYPSNIDYPVLLVSSNMSRHYGTYLRYIKDKSRFVYKKLQSLTTSR
jgi:hypothetical protein